MKQKQKARLLILALVGTAVLVVLVKGPASVIEKKKAERSAAARSQGSPEAALRIEEYTDFNSLDCAAGYKVTESFYHAYPQQVSLEVHYFPSTHSRSAEFAECAARQDNFWIFTNLIFRKQEKWRSLTDPSAVLLDLAREAGLDAKKMKACLADKSVRRIVGREKREGQHRGVTTAPAYFLNGKKVDGLADLEARLVQFFSAQWIKGGS